MKVLSNLFIFTMKVCPYNENIVQILMGVIDDEGIAYPSTLNVKV
jgi:hypothetical protein